MPIKSKSPPIKVMVSSTVYDKGEFLAQVDGVLTGYGYEVIMSALGKMFVNPKLSNYQNCLVAVEECDVFLGIITGHYGSGEVPDENVSITHLEIRHAIRLNKLRWFLVHNDVEIARLLLKQFRFKDGQKSNFTIGKNPVLSDIRVLDLCDEVRRMDEALKSRTGNWTHEYRNEADAFRFIKTQFQEPAKIRGLMP